MVKEVRNHNKPKKKERDQKGDQQQTCRKVDQRDNTNLNSVEKFSPRELQPEKR
jgi:hypothetical protein